MSLHPDLFRLPKPAAYGERVRFRQAPAPGSARPDGRDGEGTFVLQWLCLDEECFDVVLDDGERIGLIPAFGDTIEKA